MSSHDIEKDREVKKLLVAEAISSHCNDSSKFEDLRKIGQALQAGDQLKVHILSGGNTNFSYRVCLEKNPDIQLYAKLSFSRALWNPDPTVKYDLIRTTNEYKMMELFYEINPDAVAVPYLCLDIDDMKLLVTQWSDADEQWANQFVDGSVDERIIPKLAQDLAILHSKPCDPDFNTDVRDCVSTLFPASIQRTKDLLNQHEEPSRLAKFAQELGAETCDVIYEKFIKDFQTPDRLIHNDSHVFNILVEKKPDIESLEEFADRGKYILCDWEMAMSGPVGKDVGFFFPFPIACVLSHGINGHKEAADSILETIENFWTEYSLAANKCGPCDDETLLKTYRTALGWAGFFLYEIMYGLGLQLEFLPLDGCTSNIEHVKNSMGHLGLQFMNMAFGKEEDLESLQMMFRSAVEEELAHLIPKRPRRNRRSSVFRSTNRRYSDASIFFASIASQGSFDVHAFELQN